MWSPKSTRSRAGPFQAGFADAASRVIGHRPGGCPRCVLHLSREDELALDLLSIREAGTAGSLVRVARFTGAVARFLSTGDPDHASG